MPDRTAKTTTALAGTAALLGLCAATCGPSTKPGDPTLPPPEKGFQLSTPAFDVGAGEEVQNCYFFRAPDLNQGQPYFVGRIEIAMAPGSHHMNVFRQNTVVALKGPNPDGTGEVLSKNGTGPCFESPNWADWPLVVNNQESSDGEVYVMQLPDKVGHRIQPGEILMVQAHYVNATTQKTPGRGKALINFHQLAVPSSDVMELGTLFATKQSISICRDNPTPEFTGFCKFNSPDKPIQIFAANAHFHSRGKRFTMCTWDGKAVDSCGKPHQFYESQVWDDPPMAVNVGVGVPAGGGISFSCSYEWQPSPACADGCSCLGDAKNCCYKFSGVVETGEHCNVFVYYYPKINGTDINCF